MSLGMSPEDFYYRMMERRQQAMEEIQKQQFDKAEKFFQCTGKLSIASLPKVMGKQNEAMLLSDIDPLSGIARSINQLDHREDHWLNLLGVPIEKIEKPFGAISLWQSHALKVNVRVRRWEVTRFGQLIEAIQSGCVVPKYEGKLMEYHPLTLAIRRALDSILHCRVESLKITPSAYSEMIECEISLWNQNTGKLEKWSVSDVWHVGVLIQNWKQEMSEVVHQAELVFRPPNWFECDGRAVRYEEGAIYMDDPHRPVSEKEKRISEQYWRDVAKKKSGSGEGNQNGEVK